MVAIGAFVAPVIASLFYLGETGAGSKLGTMFATVGLWIILFPSTGFLLAFLSRSAETSDVDFYTGAETSTTSHKMSTRFSCQIVMSVVVFSFLIFLSTGIEKTVGTLLTTFAIRSSHLDLDLADGARMTATFWGGFAASRFIAVFASARVSARITMFVHLLLVLAASCTVLLVSRPNLALLNACAGAIGFGVGPLYSSTMLVFEESHVETTSRIAGGVEIGLIKNNVFTSTCKNMYLCMYIHFCRYLQHCFYSGAKDPCAHVCTLCGGPAQESVQNDHWNHCDVHIAACCVNGCSQES